MLRNAVVFTSTNTQEMYNVNIAYVPHSLGSVHDILGGLFAPNGVRHYYYDGQLSMVAVLHLLWPYLEADSMGAWQEWYLYQNNYDKDPPKSATMHTRHSASPEEWMKAVIQPMMHGYRFYESFWDFTYDPLYSVVNNCLNYDDYEIMGITGFAGVQEWLWPSCGSLGQKTLYVVLSMIERTHRTHRAVPWRFAELLVTGYRHRQRRHRMASM